MDIGVRLITILLSLVLLLAFVVLCAILVNKWLRRKNIPKNLRVANLLGLLPIVFAPFVFYGSIFIFDNPSNEALARLVFYAVNSYSLVLIIMMLLSIKLYLKTHSQIKAMIPLIPAMMVYCFIFFIFLI